MRIARWILKTTNTHPEYVIFIAFPLQQWLHAHASVLRYSYIVFLVELNVAQGYGHIIVHKVPAFFPGVKRTKSEDDHSPPPSTEVENERRHAPHPYALMEWAKKTHTHRYIVRTYTHTYTQGGSDHRPPDISMHPSSTTKGKAREGYISTWDLANKQTRTNN